MPTALCRSVKFPLQDSTNRFPQPTLEEEFIKAVEGVVPTCSNTKQNSKAGHVQVYSAV